MVLDHGPIQGALVTYSVHPMHSHDLSEHIDHIVLTICRTSVVYLFLQLLEEGAGDTEASAKDV